jgi:TRAP-type C4-dicarboxylate transport system permease large subunit
MTKQLLMTILMAVILSTAIGFTIGWFTRTDSANAATGQAEVIRQLKRLNVQMNALNTKTGDTQQSQGSVRGLLTIICDYTAPINCKPH